MYELNSGTIDALNRFSVHADVLFKHKKHCNRRESFLSHRLQSSWQPSADSRDMNDRKSDSNDLARNKVAVMRVHISATDTFTQLLRQFQEM